jgi:predicted O-methyltransferase YrrM
MTEPSDVDISMHRIPAIKSYRAKQQRGVSWQAVSQEDVEENLRQAGVFNSDKLRFVVGPVEQTLLEDDLPTSIALLFLDTGWHSSTLKELQILFPRLVEGGILIVDDYGHWDGARKAVNDYLGALQIQRLERIDYTAVALVR